MATRSLLNVDMDRWSVAAYTSEADSESSRRTEVATHINGPGRVSLAVYFTASEAREYAAALIAAADACDANRAQLAIDESVVDGMAEAPDVAERSELGKARQAGLKNRPRPEAPR